MIIAKDLVKNTIEFSLIICYTSINEGGYPAPVNN